MWQFYMCIHSGKFFLDHFFAILYLGSLFQMPFLNGKSLKSMRLLLLYQAIYTYRNWSITYLFIDGLHSFCHNCLTISLPTYNINEKHPTYMPVISRCCCYLKLVGAFRGVTYYGVSYCQKAFIGSMHFTTIASQLFYLSMTYIKSIQYI